MQQDELLALVVGALESLELHYFVTGSMATILYGEPRFTNDVDVVVQLDTANAEALLAAFPEEDFYSDKEQARSAVRRHGSTSSTPPRASRSTSW